MPAPGSRPGDEQPRSSGRVGPHAPAEGLGVIAPVSVLRRSAMAQLPAEKPLPVRLFIAFLVVVLWKRQADAAASSSW